MPGVVWLAVAALVLPLSVLLTPVLLRSGTVGTVARRNLMRGLSVVVSAGPLEARHTGSGAVLRLLTPESVARRVRRLLEQAGRPAGWTMTRVLWGKLAGAGAAALAGTLVVLAAPSPLRVLLTVAVAAGVYHLPEAVLSGRVKERQRALQRELPDTLDQMMIAVQAGLGFEAALARAAGGGQGALAQELARTLQDMNVGRPRREAYEALMRRTDVTDLKRFVSAVNQADAYGIPLADVLRVQADEMRLKRRQRAEAKAMEVPVKVLFPLMLCILPALLLVVVGPAVMSLGDVL